MAFDIRRAELTVNAMKLPYIIKKRQKHLIAYVIVGLFMLTLSVVCLFFPFITVFKSVFSPKVKEIYMIIGCVCTPFYTFYTCYNFLNLISPPAGIILKKKGFYEHTMADGRVGFIPAEAVTSLKLFGNKSKRYLGIKISPNFIDELGESKKAKYELQNNMESGMPAIIIREKDITIAVSDLLSIMLELYSHNDVATTDTIPADNALLLDEDPTISAEKEDLLFNTNTDTNEVLAISQDDSDSGIRVLPLDRRNAESDVPIIVNDNEKPRITSVDELLSHLMINQKQKETAPDEIDKKSL